MVVTKHIISNQNWGVMDFMILVGFIWIVAYEITWGLWMFHDFHGI